MSAHWCSCACVLLSVCNGVGVVHGYYVVGKVVAIRGDVAVVVMVAVAIDDVVDVLAVFKLVSICLPPIDAMTPHHPKTPLPHIT